ncbi:hypothetical protein M1105_19905 [Limibaculum sp. FT325]|uniref:hypothetical protein n=1 Tax=Thermohalobaculum sediminis TaxID=2939436 RepID=UPI0020BECA68|nr:hypothetical protein [Limibaculum sediminis]MCL5779229.1 hypothetical protein [Limibaculum sediminis]
MNLTARLWDEAQDGEILLPTRASITVEGTYRTEAVGEIDLKGWCQTNANSSQFAGERRISGRAELTPLLKCGGSVDLEDVPA